MADDQGQDVLREQRGQKLPGDKKRAEHSQMEGPAAYAPHDDDEPTSVDQAQQQREDMQRRAKAERN